MLPMMTDAGVFLPVWEMDGFGGFRRRVGWRHHIRILRTNSFIHGFGVALEVVESIGV